MNWITEHALFLITLSVAAAGVWWLMPERTHRPRAVGVALVLGAVAVLLTALARAEVTLSQQVLSTLFAGGALLCGTLMITSRNPAYGALWFALVTLCTCGMFLEQSAPFLAAATIIVYAGAIIVTFLFVIMLAQTEGETTYDQRSRRPFLSTLAAFVLLGLVLTSLDEWSRASAATGAQTIVATDGVNPLSRVPADQPLGEMRGLGRSLFGDYLFAVETAGTLLLIASIGAIAIAPRRSQGTL
ncbi:MAG: NADH-quinone oxidoreductase subunit J [Planctomycetaceae bacterium]